MIDTMRDDVEVVLESVGMTHDRYLVTVPRGALPVLTTEAAQADAQEELQMLRNKVDKYESDHPWAKANQEVMLEAVADMEKARALVGELVDALNTLHNSCQGKRFDFDTTNLNTQVRQALTKAQAFMEGK